MEELDEFMRIHRELEDSLKVPVLIGHDEVFKIVIRDLIAKRNSTSNLIVDEFDQVLQYYLGGDDFIKYVLKGEKIV